MTEPGVGHNSIDNGQLKAFIERVERMEEEKKEGNSRRLCTVVSAREAQGGRRLIV